MAVHPLYRCEDKNVSHSRYTFWWRHPTAVHALPGRAANYCTTLVLAVSNTKK